MLRSTRITVRSRCDQFRWTRCATIEEFEAEGYTHVECFCPRCDNRNARPIVEVGLPLHRGERRRGSLQLCLIALAGRLTGIRISVILRQLDQFPC